jgi:hypothetical protein
VLEKRNEGETEEAGARLHRRFAHLPALPRLSEELIADRRAEARRKPAPAG